MRAGAGGVCEGVVVAAAAARRDLARRAEEEGLGEPPEGESEAWAGEASV